MKHVLSLWALLMLGVAFSADALVAQKNGEGRVDTIVERNDYRSAPSSTESEYVYVTNQGEASVSVIDMQSHEKVATVDLQELGFSANAQPHHVAVEADGSAWYVSLISENVVLKFDRQNELVGQFQFQAPGLMALHPEEDLIYVARSMMAVDPPQSLGVANRSEMDDLREIGVFFNRPHALTITSDGEFIYSASLATNQLIGIPTESERGELTSIEGTTQVLVQLAATPDGRTIIGGGQLTGQLLIFEAQDDGRLELQQTLNVGAQPWHPIIDDEGRYAYVPNKQSNDVAVVDLQTLDVIDTIEDESFAQPHGSAISSDGRYLFVSNNHSIERMQDMMEMEVEQHAGGDHEHHEEHGHHHEEDDDRNGTVSVINLDTREVVSIIEVGEYPTGMGAPARY